MRKIIFTWLLPLLVVALVSASEMNTSMSTGKLTPEALVTMLRMGSFALSPKGDLLVYSTTQASIKDDKSFSQLWLKRLDKANANDLPLTKYGQAAVAQPSFIAGGSRIAFMQRTDDGMQLFSMDISGMDRRQLTRIKGGIEGYLFSPDEKQIIYIAAIPFGKRVKEAHPDLPKATGRIVEDLMYKHWDEWIESIPHPFLAQVGVDPITSGKDLLEGEPYEAPMRPFSGISDLAFTPDGKQIAYASRKKTGIKYALSTNSDIYLYDIASQETRNLTEGMMGYDTHPIFSPKGGLMAWCSMERDGYESDLKRLFTLDLKSGKKTYLTAGFECNVEDPFFSEDGKKIYFISCIQAETHLFEVDIKSRKIRQITTGQYDYTALSVAGKTAIAGRQSMVAPTDLYRVDLKNGKSEQITALNASVLSSLAEVKCEKRWMTTTNGEQMLVWVVYPPHFDASKKYPSILYCQGGPQNTISQFWSYRWNPRLMAEHGYVVILPNRHGVPSFGKAWNEQISGDYGGQNMRDYMTAADEMKKESFIDPRRMGCVGASYGGFSVYWLAGNHEGRFACFIAHAGIFNMEAQYLETEEKFFANWDMGGAPWEKDNPIAQRTFANSPHLFADKWDTPILVIHGELDYRILASQGMMAFDAARMRGIPCKMLLYPDENHWILRPQNSMLWHRTFYGWLDEWLKK